MLVNDGIELTPGSGASLAHHDLGSDTTKLLLQVWADPYGQVTRQHYVAQLPPMHMNANSYPWELFNGLTSGLTLRLESAQVYIQYDVGAASGGLSWRADLFRTTDLSSGGTAYNFESSSTLSASIARLDTNDAAISSQVTIKTRLTSITTGAHLGTLWLSRTTTAADFSSMLPQAKDVGPQRQPITGLTIRNGQGIAVRTGTVGASGVSFVWKLQFSAEP